MNTKLAHLLTALGLCALLAGLLTEIILYSSNTLFLQNEWNVKKNESEINLMGGLEFITSRSTLSHNRLNLGKWYGHHEVYRLDAPKRDHLLFDLYFTEQSRITLILGKHNGTHFKLLLSAHPLFPSSLIRIKEEQEKITPLDIKTPLKGNLTVEVQSPIASKQSFVKIGEEKIPLSLPELFSSRLGFIGGANNSAVKEVDLYYHQRHMAHYNFKNRKNWFPLFFVNLTLFFLVFMPIIALGLPLGRPSLSMAPLSLQITTLILLSTYWNIDYYFWSPRPYSPETKRVDNFELESNNIPRIEIIRYYFFKLWHKWHDDFPPLRPNFDKTRYQNDHIWQGPQLCHGPGPNPCEIIKRSKLLDYLDREGNKFIIVVMGTSQTFGVGAMSLNTSFVAQTYQRIYREHPQINPILINLSRLGLTTHDLYQKNKKTLEEIRSNLFILNFGFNDPSKNYKNGLEKLIKHGQKNAKQIVLMQEAMSIEHTEWNIRFKNQVTKSLALKYETPLIPWQEHLAQELERRQQDLWVDIVHLNELGHKIGGEYLAEQLSPLLPQKR